MQNHYIQFSLSSLFLLTTAVCFLYTANEIVGSFLTSLILGIPTLVVVMSFLRVQNLILNSLLGFALALAIVCAAAWLNPSNGQNCYGQSLEAALIAYPMFGYCIGFFYAAFLSISDY